MLLMSFAVRDVVLYPHAVAATSARHAARAAGLRSRRDFILIADVEAAHPVAELVALDVEQPRRLALVPLRLLGRLEDQRPLDVADQPLEIDALLGKRR